MAGIAPMHPSTSEEYVLLPDETRRVQTPSLPRRSWWRGPIIVAVALFGFVAVALRGTSTSTVTVASLSASKSSSKSWDGSIAMDIDTKKHFVKGVRGRETLGQEFRKEEYAEAEEHVYDMPQKCPGSHGKDSDLSDNREALQMTDGEYYPFLSSHKFMEHNEDITHAVIWIHGFSGNADKYFCDGERFVRKVKREHSTITLAPWFGAEYAFLGKYWTIGLKKDARMKVWGQFNWMTGEIREIDEPTLTSFEMVDLLILNLRNRSAYPNLKRITIAGFSAGCQFASRYAFFTDVPHDSPGEAKVHIIASNCGSYMYLDHRRPSASCRPNHNDGREHKCREFEAPLKVMNFNKYKVGLRGVKFDEKAIKTLVDRFPTQHIRFLFGDEDVCNCNDPNYANPELCSRVGHCEPSAFSKQCCDTSPDNLLVNVLDVRDAAMVQGWNRLQRGLNYVHYLRMFYQNETFPEFGIFSGGHDSEAFANHPQFLEWALDYKAEVARIEKSDDEDDPKVKGPHGDETIVEEERKEDKEEAHEHLDSLPQKCPTKNGVDSDLVDNREALEMHNGEYYPFLCSKTFLKRDEAITHAVIWIHGFSGNADKYFCDGERFVKEMGREKGTITIAPWFGAEYAYKGKHWAPGLPDDARMKVWGSFRWMTGEMREIDEPTLTSFEMVDLLALNLRNKSIYPNLRKITIAGFSAGCQFSSRYAFFSDIPLHSPGEASVQVIASNCGSYMYLDDTRPSKSCRPSFDDGPEHRCTKFEEPHPLPSGFNKYKIGLNGVKFNEDDLQKLIDKFPTKNIRFLFGDEDVCDCNDASYTNPDLCSKIARCEPSVFKEQCCDTSPDNKMENVFDVKPASMLQGYNRLQRGLNYVSYLRNYYKSGFPEFDVFRGGHDSEAFAKHPKFMEWALDFPRPDEPSLEDPDDEDAPKVKGTHGDETLKEEESKEAKEEEQEHLDILPQKCPVENGVDSDLVDNREALQMHDGEYYPFLCSKTFLKRDEAIIHAVIWIHGFSGNADKYFCDGERFVKEMGREKSTITIAPWFGAEYAYKGKHWAPGLPKDARMKVWGSFRWMTGEMREIDEPTLTSFEMVDLLVLNLRNKSIYPNLKKVTIAGFSAGCQFSSRYAFFSEIPLHSRGEALVQVIASNCGSYMYLDDTRPSKSCRPNFDDGPEHRCTEFEKPHPHPLPHAFNTYKIGLNGVKFGEADLQKLIEQFPKKNIRFLFGDEDVCDCNDASYKNPKLCSTIASCEPTVFKGQCCDTSPDNKMENVFDVKPASMLQGYNRLQRGLNYVSYLRNYYKSGFPEFDVFRGGHDSEAFAKHPKFMEWALDFPRPDEPALEDPDDEDAPKVEGTHGDETLKEEESKEAIDEAQEHLDILPQKCPVEHGVDSDLVDNREALQMHDDEYYPFLCSKTFLKRDEAIIHAVIWIHGFSGNADKYFCDGERFVKEMGREKSTITIAPWFGAEYAYKGKHWARGLPKDAKMKVWGSFRWMTGEVREIDEPTLTSFEMVDLLALNLRNKSIYPNLKKITIAGFSAGCQFSSRYAFFSEIPQRLPGEAEVQVIASNCGSYMYLDHRRPAPSCRPNFDDGTAHECRSYDEPSPLPASFNTYKIGLRGVKFSEETLKQLIDDFQRKNIRFLLGDEDVCDCNSRNYTNPKLCGEIANCLPTVFKGQCCDTSPDNKMENVFDVKPAAMLQGYNRLQRGLNYVYYLRQFYNGEFPEFDIFHGGHDSEAFARHPKFLEWALDYQVKRKEHPSPAPVAGLAE